jgi:Tfp pilus assembly protein PilN
MKPFNLAEAKITERTYCKQQLSRRLRIIALLAFLSLGAVAVSYGCKVTVRGRATRFRSELADVQGRCIAIKNEIAAIKAKSSQRKWQRQLAGSSKRWLGILNAVVNQVPGDLWLSRLESSESSSSISIEGQAASFASMSQFIGAIRSSPNFADVRINSTRVATPP